MAIREHPLLCNTQVVQAILSGRQTQDRRPITKANSIISEGGDWDLLDFEGKSIHGDPFRGNDIKAPHTWKDGKPETGQYLHVPYDWEEDQKVYRIYPRWEVGDRLWVREACYKTISGLWVYKVDNFPLPISLDYTNRKSIPSIFMPRHAARVILEITGIRAGRIQKITYEEAIAEGCKRQESPDDISPVWQFKELWDFLYEKKGYGWDTDCWTWIYDLKKLEAK